MSPRLRCCCALILGAVASGSGAAAHPLLLLPALSGELSGELYPFGEDPALKLQWSVRAASSDAGERLLSGLVRSESGQLEFDLRLDNAEGRGHWSLKDTTVPLSPWWGAVAAQQVPALNAWTASGAVQLGGSGQVDLTAESWTGELRLSGAGLQLNNAEEELEATDVSFALALALPALSSPARQTLRFARARLGEIEVVNGEVQFEMKSAALILVTALQFEAFGGIVRCDPFAFDPSSPQVDVVVRVENVALEALRTYVSDTVSAMEGRVSGHLAVQWTEASGLQLGRGSLLLKPGERAVIRLAAAPGFLSSRVPEAFDMAPGARRFLGKRLLMSENPAHRALEEIELGEEALVIESLEAVLTPPSSNGDSKANIQIVARPARVATRQLVKRLKLNLNVSGPLSEVLRFGMDGRVSWGE